jgi:hypothetical protein
MGLEYSRRGIFAGIALATSLVCAAPALAGPLAKARYDGRDATHKRAFMRVAKDGRSVARFGFATRTRCSDGKRHPVIFVNDRRTTPRILADGSFNHHEVEGRDRADVTGQFDPAGNTVTGIYSVTYHFRGHTCSTGDVTYTLHRDGTAGAAFRTPLVASGLYSASGRGLKLSMRPLVPGGLIHSFRVVYATRCSSGKTVPWELRLVVPIVKRGRFGAVVSERAGHESGRTDITRARIAGVFAYAGGYKLAGKLSARNLIKKPGEKPVVCRATIPFTGGFIRGPLGEEGPHPAS